MLVLSRRLAEKIDFPNLGISIQVLRVAGQAVRLGIDAPPEVRIVREEVAAESAGEGAAEPPVLNLPVLTRQLRRALRKRLDAACVGLQRLHRRLEKGTTQGMEATIFQIFRELQQIELQLRPPGQGRSAKTSEPAQRAPTAVENPAPSELLTIPIRHFGT